MRPFALLRRMYDWVLSWAGSLLGGLLGYSTGYAEFETVGQPSIAFYGAADRYDRLGALYDAHGFWSVFVAGLMPIPYKVTTIATGVFEIALVPFTIASLAVAGSPRSLSRPLPPSPRTHSPELPCRTSRAA